MLTRTTLLVYFVVFANVFALGQRPFFVVETARKGNDFRFPILKARPGRYAETKINHFLQLSELWGLVDRKRQDVFDQAMINDGSIYGGKVSLSYSIYANNPRVLSIEINDSMDGATTHWWTSYYNFNSQNGDRISLPDLFTENGYKDFVSKVAKKRLNAYRAEVAKKIRPGERESFLNLIGYIKDDDLTDFVLRKRSITIDGDNLLGKSFCCEAINMAVNFDLSEFRRYLNEYGELVFGLRSGNLAKFRSNRLPQLFNGTVDGQFPFVMVLNSIGGGQFGGLYAYLKYRKGIYLTGSIDDKNIELTERVLTETEMHYETRSNHRWVDGGSITGVFDGSTLRGTWTDKAKQESLSFLVSRD